MTIKELVKEVADAGHDHQTNNLVFGSKVMMLCAKLQEPDTKVVLDDLSPLDSDLLQIALYGLCLVSVQAIQP